MIFMANTVHSRPSFPRKRESRDGRFEAAFLDSRLRGNDEIMGLYAYLNCIVFMAQACHRSKEIQP